MDSSSELKLVSLISQLMFPTPKVKKSTLHRIFDARIRPFIEEVMSVVKSMDLDSQPKPETEFMSLISLIRSIDFDSQPEPLSKLKLLMPGEISKPQQIIYVSPWLAKASRLDPEPELMSLIHRIFSLVIAMNSSKLIPLCTQAQVYLKDGKFQVVKAVSRKEDNKWECLPINWIQYTITGEEEDTYFYCPNCNGVNHKEYKKASSVLFVGRIHYPYPKMKEDGMSIHFLCFRERLLSLQRMCLNILSTFKRVYMCPPCNFVIHQSCISLPRLIRISRHPHRISFTPSFDQGDLKCRVCRTKIDSKCGGYSCIKDGCSYVAHSKCATQSNVWDGQELEGLPEEEKEDIEPFMRISDGVIQHFSHQHHLRLDENTGRDYDENNQCQACIMPIYFGNFYSCMQCDFILHEDCAKLSRKMYHPIHPHQLTLVAGYDGVPDFVKDKCSVFPWFCKAGFFYECVGCDFKLQVQCATLSEPLDHESHMHHLFLTSKPGDEERWCSVCRSIHGKETFNCIECDFTLCFKCATWPRKVRYKHDKHMLTLSCGKKTSTMIAWCEVCETEINQAEWFYMCDEYCCVTLHIGCLLGFDILDYYMKSSSEGFCYGKKVRVLPNNLHFSRPICSRCKKRCPHKIVFECSGVIFCSSHCVHYGI